MEPDMHHCWIMAFDLENEVWQPDALRGPAHQNNVTLATLQGQLVACHEDHQTYELWFLVDPEQALWSMRHRILMPYQNVRSPLTTGDLSRIFYQAISGDRRSEDRRVDAGGPTRVQQHAGCGDAVL